MRDKEKVAQWMIERGFVTGHGDTIEDLLKEIEWQVKEREREACAKRKWVGLTEVEIYELMEFDEYEDQFDFAYAIEAKLKEKNCG